MTTKLSGPREALRQAIEAHAETAAHVAKLQASSERIQDQLYAAQGHIELAREADEAEQAERVRAVVSGGEVMELTRADPGAVREVERTIAACKSALAICRTEAAAAETELGYKTLRVRSLAGEVLAPKFGEILLEAEALHHALAGKLATLSFLQGSLVAGMPEILRFRALMHQLLADQNHEAVAPWKATYDALTRDAGTELPR